MGRLLDRTENIAWRVCVVLCLLTLSQPAVAADFTAHVVPSRPLPVAQQEVELTFSLTGDSAQSAGPLRMAIEQVEPDGQVSVLKAPLDASDLPSSDKSGIRITCIPRMTGIHRYQVRISRPGIGQDVIVPAGQVPVMAAPLQILYWNALPTTRYLTWRLCTDEQEATYWSSRGVTTARWMPGITHRQWTQTQFVERWSQPLPEGFGAIAIDEFRGVGDDAVDLELARALLQLKAQAPDQPVAVWSISLDPQTRQAAAFRAAADLVMIECYSPHFAAYGRFAERWDAVRRAALTDKMVFAVWLGRVLTTEADLRRQIRHIRHVAPEARGLCFNGEGSESLLAVADQLVYEYFVKPTLVLEKGARGQWICRNTGWMTARDVAVVSGDMGGDRRMIASVEPGQSVELDIAADRPIAIEASEHYTWLDRPDEDRMPLPPVVAASSHARAEPSAANMLVQLQPVNGADRGACMRLPLAGGALQPPFTLEFTIAFESIGPYGVVAVGLGHAVMTDYSDAFLDHFPRNRWPGRLEMRFYRGDAEIRSAYPVAGARGHFGFENAASQFVRTTPNLSFTAGGEYRVRIDGRPTSMELTIVALSGDDRKPWRSGKMAIDAIARLDELYLRVREAEASTIVVDRQRGHVQLHSGTKKGPDDRVTTRATIRDVRLTSGDGVVE